jgi:hypothetical protein
LLPNTKSTTQTFYVDKMIAYVDKMIAYADKMIAYADKMIAYADKMIAYADFQKDLSGKIQTKFSRKNTRGDLRDVF